MSNFRGEGSFDNSPMDDTSETLLPQVVINSNTDLSWLLKRATAFMNW